MGELAYMKVGTIKGPAPFTDKDPGQRKGLIAVRAASHQVLSDLDPKTGTPSGGITHKTFSVRKKIDFSSPHLHDAHKNSSTNTVEIRFFHMPRSGNETLYLTITLVNARIVKYSTTMPHLMAPGMSLVHEYEDIDFLYESISWAFTKHESDPQNASGGNTVTASDVLSAFGPDWIEEEAKAKALEVAGRLRDELAEQMLNAYKAEHPDEFPK
jgi:type VI secretion system Hcp family effector